MSRRVVLVLVTAIVVVVGAAVALVVTARPDLDDRRRAVDTRWAPLREPLATRYDGLGRLADALAASGAGERSYTVDLVDALIRWRDLADGDRPEPGPEAATANRLEGLAARVRANVARSARLARDPDVLEALAVFDAALVPQDAVDRYNRAVRRYQSSRTELLHRWPADLLGYDPRPVLVVGAGGGPDADA